ncbi:hypothetical protein D7X25_18485 [bacterium 1XD42-8]|jgi:cell division septum initiation protein DivIVA|nr:hypothetical protein [Lachnospiraceae bacterium]RKJ50389.1 hypothetical protein D7X25_18485 [bacterium 1XD42-8]
MSSRIEQLIEEIEEYIEGCKFQKFSSTNIIVDKEEIDELLRELRMKTPDEIKRYQKIVSNKEAILNDAKEKAAALINEAQIHTNNLINEHEIMQQAYAQANEVVKQATVQAQAILDNATMDANNIRMSAMQYTDDMLANLQNIIEHSIDTARAKYDALLMQLGNCADIVNTNRAQMYPPEEMDDLENHSEGESNSLNAVDQSQEGIHLDMLSK